MSMKTNHFILSILTGTFLTVFVACTKESATKPDTTDSTSSELTTHADDQARFSTETDIVTNEALVTVEGTASISGMTYTQVPEFCDATISYDTLNATRSVTITYNGGNCSGAYIRTGTVVLSMPAGVYWKNAGAVLTISYQDLKLTRKSDSKSFTVNGSHTITNVSGGLLVNLTTRTSITHAISSNGMTITFDDNTQRTWQVAENRVFTYDNGVVITITGNHTEGSNTAIALWGTNRFGQDFTTSITQPLILKQDCDFRLTSGQVTHAGFGTATTTYGLNATGEPTSCPGTASYYCKVSWTGPAGHTYNALFQY